MRREMPLALGQISDDTGVERAYVRSSAMPAPMKRPNH